MANVLSHLHNGDTPAIVSPNGDVLTYSQLNQRVGAMAGGMLLHGLKPGDKVVLLIPMGAALYIHLLALLRIGVTATLVDPAADIQSLLDRHPPDGLIGVPKAHFLRLTVPALRGLRFYGSTGFTPLPHRRTDHLSGPCPPIQEDPGPALLTFTSGTTGVPKAIARSHDFLLNQHTVLQTHMPFSTGDIDLPTLPVFLLHSLAGGATCVIADANLRRVGQVDPKPIIDQLIREKITSSSGSPAFFQVIADHLKTTGENVTTLRDIYMGGARVSVSLVDDLSRLLPNVSIHIVYGSTEAEPIAVLDAKAHRDRLQSSTAKGALVGRPVENIQLRIVGSPVGEIQVAGAHVNPAYVNDPHADTETKVREGDTVWHRTGDVGYLDDDGYLWLVGRVGESVAGHWPLVVEGAAESFSFVAKAGLVAIDDQPLLAVVLRHAPNDWMKQLGAVIDIPIQAIPAIPVDPRHNAKINRVLLRERLRG